MKKEIPMRKASLGAVLINVVDCCKNDCWL